MLGFLNDLLWGQVLIYGLVAAGLLFTLGSRLVQFRYFVRMFGILRNAFRHDTDKPTSFQALALSVAGRVGAGNLAGVAVAITLGGPGAIFWMWLIGLVGMATSFFECSLAQLYKQVDAEGNYRGGPAVYIEKGLKTMLGGGAKVMASIYAVLLLVTFGFAFNVLQSYSVASSFDDAFGIPSIATGAVLAAVIGVIIFGGVKRIAQVAEVIVPIMAIGYLAMALVVVAMNISALPDVIERIVLGAFGFDEAVAGGIGAAILQGVRRGLFSNEAGLGSAPNVAAVAYVKHPGNQGVVQAFSVFIDTLIICTCTASVILLSGIDITATDVGGVALTQNAMAAHVGDWGRSFVSIALMLFVFSSIMYNYYLGENALEYFADNKILFHIFRGATMVFVLLGSTVDLSTAFAFADVTMGLLAIVNLTAVILLFKTGLRILKDFDTQFRSGRTPVFDSAKYADLDIDHEAWKLEPADAVLLESARAAPA
jgi:AGCS family alanine or glycine:cation symporter